MIKIVDDDKFEHDLINELIDNDVNVNDMQIWKKQQLNITFILINDKNEKNRIFVSFNNANYFLTFANFEILFDSRSNLIILQLKFFFEIVCHIFKLIKIEKIFIFNNFVLISTDENFKKIYANLKYFILNEFEIRIFREKFQNEKNEKIAKKRNE